MTLHEGFYFDALAEHRAALIAFYASQQSTPSAPAMFKLAVPDALAATGATEIALLKGDARGAYEAMWRAMCHFKGVARYGALELGATTAAIDGARAMLWREKLEGKG